MLALVACPSCFAQIFRGSKHCSFCGAAAVRALLDDGKPRSCPRCRAGLTPVAVGAAAVAECLRCGGLWVDVASFGRICADREQQAAVLGTASPPPVPQGHDAPPRPQGYLPCPECTRLMNRVNFARCSGVIVDICKGHGTWFDHEELRRIVEFIRAGGLERSRERLKEEVEEERRALRREERHGTASEGGGWSGASSPSGPDYGDIISFAADLLGLHR